VFQCSSASRKFLNERVCNPDRGSAAVSVLFSEPKIPQSTQTPEPPDARPGFSALQRAENSSISIQIIESLIIKNVSVLFSEPKIPQ